MTNSIKEKFITEISNTFQECYKVRPYLGSSIEPMLKASLQSTQEGDIKLMKGHVMFFFEDPSSFDSGSCSELFMKVVEDFPEEVTTIGNSEL